MPRRRAVDELAPNVPCVLGMNSPITNRPIVAVLFCLLFSSVAWSNSLADGGQASTDTSPMDAATEDRWRKTTHGWEWLEPAAESSPQVSMLRLHPLVLAALQVLATVAIWLASDVASQSRKQRLPDSATCRRQMQAWPVQLERRV